MSQLFSGLYLKPLDDTLQQAEVWCSWWANTNAQWSYQQLLIEFIQNTHQDALKILASALFDQKFGESKAINWAGDDSLLK